MSNVDLKNTVIQCELDMFLQPERSGRNLFSLLFARKFIEAQNKVKADELGDVIIEGEEVTGPICLELGIDPANDEVRRIGFAAISCLEKRYLGICSVATCKGKESTDRLINEATKR